MYSAPILMEAVVNGLLTGAVYALVALGLTLVYGVLHIINFAHGALLSCALFAAWGAAAVLGVSPYAALVPLAALFFGFGYALQRLLIGPAGRGSDVNMLLITLGLSIVIENGLLAAFASDTRALDGDAAFQTVEIGPMLISTPRLIGFAGAMVMAALLFALLRGTDTGRAIRAIAKEPLGGRLVGINVPHVFAVTFGISCACLAVAACLLIPTFYASPRVGNAFVLVAFTVVVLGGMGSVPGALIGALAVGVVESLGGLFLGDSLGQLGVYVLFILVLLFRPRGLFGARA